MKWSRLPSSGPSSVEQSPSCNRRFRDHPTLNKNLQIFSRIFRGFELFVRAECENLCAYIGSRGT